jgi:type IV secretion system protein VirB5
MNPFRRPSVRYGKTPAPETPYQKAAQVWDERIGTARVQARNWRLIAFGNLALAAGLAGGLVWHAMRGTVVPWVVQVDNLGQAQAVAPAIADYKPTDGQIAWHLARFIEQVRSIPVDPIIVRMRCAAVSPVGAVTSLLAARPPLYKKRPDRTQQGPDRSLSRSK